MRAGRRYRVGFAGAWRGSRTGRTPCRGEALDRGRRAPESRTARRRRGARAGRGPRAAGSRSRSEGRAGPCPGGPRPDRAAPGPPPDIACSSASKTFARRGPGWTRTPNGVASSASASSVERNAAAGGRDAPRSSSCRPRTGPRTRRRGRRVRRRSRGSAPSRAASRPAASPVRGARVASSRAAAADRAADAGAVGATR